MRIAIVYPFFAHYRGPIIERLSADEHIEYVFLAGTKTNPPFSSLKLYDFGDKRNFVVLKNFWFFKYFLWQLNLNQELKKGRFDGVVFLSDWKYLSIWPAIYYLRKTQTPFWFWSHGILNETKSLNNKIKYYFHTLFKKGGFLYSNRARILMLKKGYKSDLNVIYNSLDYRKQLSIINDIEQKGAVADLPVEKPYFIFTGRLIPERNLEILFEAIKILKDQDVEINTLILGDGPHLEQLKSEAEKRELTENVVFTGACYDEFLIGYYFINAVACVFPGPIGLTIIHSMTYGTAVITNDNYDSQKPEIEALDDNVNGFLFQEGNVMSLVEKMKKILFLTVEEKQQLKQNAQKTIAEKFTPEFQAKIITETILKEAAIKEPRIT